MRRFATLLLAAGFLLGAFTGCATQGAEETSGRELVDQLGRTVKLEGTPQTIVSLAPGNTEILFALGLSEKIVGVTKYCNYPEEAKEIADIGGFSTPNIEEIVARQPDLILATSIHEKKIIPQLEEKGLTVLALDAGTLDGVLQAITLTGEATGAVEAARALTREMAERMARVTEITSSLSADSIPGVLYVVWHDPLKVAGAGTLHDELIRLAGGKNVADNISEYADISLEAVLAANPDVMIASVSHGASGELTYQFLLSEERLNGTAAKTNSRIYFLDGNIVSRTGPRLVEGLETFARFFHPELFPE